MSQRSYWKRPALSPDSKEQSLEHPPRAPPPPPYPCSSETSGAKTETEQGRAKGYRELALCRRALVMGGMACLTWRASTVLGSMSLVLVVLVCASMHHYRSLIDFKGGDGVALL